MDRKVYKERMRRKQRQLRMRRYMRLGTYAVGIVLVMVFVIRGVILPIVHSLGGNEPNETVEVQAQTAEADPNAAIRQPLKGQGDLTKTSELTPGWHEDENGRWYQNADHTYYAGGFQEIDGVTYCFSDNGYVQTGWVSKGVKDYYFNEDGSYNPEKRRSMIAMTFDDGPGQYTDTLLDILEENNARATFFMLGQNVGYYQDTVKRMADMGCEIGSHSWDHPNLYNLSLEDVAKQFSDTDNALIEACGQAATVARAPYGNESEDIINTVGKPFFMWSLDSLDWSYKDVDLDYQSIMVDNSSSLSDGTIILMHDIHEASVEACKRIIPDLIAQGYKLVTVSELAEAKNVSLQYASYNNFWDSYLEGLPGYQGSDDSGLSGSESTEGEDSGDGISDGTEDSGDEISDGTEDSDEDISDGSDYGDSFEDGAEYSDGE
ncbi:MAG: polysaccharide deacetylase family protein [Eubacteriales bacterium]|nr:polysaccharide deacetylase family protein [Eubacteriales bacterium]